MSLRLQTGWFVLALAALACPVRAGAASAATPRHNVLIIVLDDVGTEKLAMYKQGPTFARTPRLDAFRQRGILFMNAYVNPICGPSRAAFMTGRYGFRTGFGPNIMTSANPPWQLSDSEVFLSELVRDGLPPGSYARGAFGKWHLAEDGNDRHPVQNGFEYFAGCMFNVQDPGHGSHHYSWRKVTLSGAAGGVRIVGDPNGPFTEKTWDASVNRRDAIEWIKQQMRPFLAYVAFNPPHQPLQVPPGTLLSAATRNDLATALNGPYVPGDIADPNGDLHKRLLFQSAMVEAVDTDIGKLLDGIDPAQLANTTVIIVSDNGTDAAAVEEPPYDHELAKRGVYQLGTRVPLIIGGELVPSSSSGATCNALVAAVDLWRTVADITGAQVSLAVTDNRTIDSLSILPLLQNPASAGSRTRAFCEVFKPNGPQLPGIPPAIYRRAINEGHFKYMRFLPPVDTQLPPTIPQELFFDLIADPFERTNLNDGQHALTPQERMTFDQLKTEFDALTNSGN